MKKEYLTAEQARKLATDFLAIKGNEVEKILDGIEKEARKGQRGAYFLTNHWNSHCQDMAVEFFTDLGYSVTKNPTAITLTW